MKAHRGRNLGDRKLVRDSSVFESELRAICSAGDPTHEFELLDRIGKGAYGHVYKAKQKSNNEIIAIKIMELNLEDDKALQNALKEISFLAESCHPNIVKYVGSFLKGTDLWLAMEFCGGGSIQDFCQVLGRGLSEEQIAFIMRESLRGLEYLHSNKKMHRDIKAGNILVTDKGEIKLADFGVSAQLKNTIAEKNTMIGTPYWMAPEIIGSQIYDARADIWSLGITAIELAEIVPPRNDLHPMQVLFQIPTQPPPELKDKKKWSYKFHDFISSSLVKDYKLRPTATKLLQHEFVSGTLDAIMLIPLLYEKSEAKKKKKEGKEGGEEVEYNSDESEFEVEDNDIELDENLNIKAKDDLPSPRAMNSNYHVSNYDEDTMKKSSDTMLVPEFKDPEPPTSIRKDKHPPEKKSIIWSAR